MNRRLLLGKQEVTYGLDPVNAAINALYAANVNYKPTGQRVPTQVDKPGAGALAEQTYGEHVELSFEIPLVGSGAAGTAPKWGPIMRACAWGETIVAATSVTYAPLLSGAAATSMTFRWRDALRSHLVRGWRGKVDFKLGAGGLPMLVFTGKGLHSDVAAGAELAQADADFTGWLNSLPVANGTTTFSLGGVAGLGIREFGITQNDNVVFVDLPEQEDVRIVGERKFSGNLVFSTPAIGTYNPETKWRTGALEVFALVHGTVAGRIVTVNGRTQLTDVSFSRDGTTQEDITSCGIGLATSGLSTDDEISLVLT